MIVIPKDEYKKLNDELNEILKKYKIKPKKFKWNRFNSRDKVDALEEFLRSLFRLMHWSSVHIHAIIWDIKDSRHNIVGRDDIKNLSLMYYKLIKNFADDKLENGDTLTVYPDRNNSIDWKLIEEILPNDGIYNTKELEFCTACYSKVFINESNTDENSLIQIADIFAGMARTSHEDYGNYEKWLNSAQQSLFGEPIHKVELSGKDRHRFRIYKFVNEYAKQKSWKVSLKTNRGFSSFKDESKPLNFWFYEPQHEKDKAPLKDK